MIIIHGEDTEKSYQFLTQEIDKEKSAETVVRIFDIKEIDSTEIRTLLTSETLFGQKTAIVIKDLLSDTKSAQTSAILDIIKSGGNNSLILYEKKNLSPSILKNFSQARIVHFPLSTQIFKFLDRVRPNNGRNLVVEYQSLILSEPPELIHHMLVRQLKNLIVAKHNPGLLKLAPYPKKLIQNQAAGFSLDDLVEKYHMLLSIDIKNKTGSTPLNITELTEHFLQKL